MHHYERLSPLVPLKTSLGGKYEKVKPGDCVVTFSRASVFQVRKKIEEATKQQCAVIYGGLPPGRSGVSILCTAKWFYDLLIVFNQYHLLTCLYVCIYVYSLGCLCCLADNGMFLSLAVRVEQAEKFNNPDCPVNILVATDAIGMGLNL